MAIAPTVVWLALGVYGVMSYVHQYYTYRGFPPPRDPPGITRGRLENVGFFSPALGRERRYLIYLPPGYDAAARAGRRFPVLYLLHGSPGWPKLFWDAGRLGVDLDQLVASGRVRPFLVVAPGGGDGSLTGDTEWANTPRGRYEDLVIDTVRAVERRWPTIRSRRFRVLGGDSEGGYAAVNVALHHPNLFGAVESWSGYFVQHSVGPFGAASRAMLRANSPADYVSALAPQLRRDPLRAFLYVGRGDPGLADVSRFAIALRRAGAHVEFAAFPGKHSWRLWRAQVPRMLRFASDSFGSP